METNSFDTTMKQNYSSPRAVAIKLEPLTALLDDSGDSNGLDGGDIPGGNTGNDNGIPESNRRTTLWD